eukprot:CAMPEP_0180078960 /NCGR_PEP_ID=MMETSP0985-20121206/16612_1 /TAXON_ID=483367 /ORGANISM="non described non described, Strain CCMP 2436" /LENGTH=112 /DNA_ID=CAMNT_0022011601 /DNA_START=48 /DNA_END=385 /DNA_ORIENTATION=+
MMLKPNRVTNDDQTLTPGGVTLTQKLAPGVVRSDITAKQNLSQPRAANIKEEVLEGDSERVVADVQLSDRRIDREGLRDVLRANIADLVGAEVQMSDRCVDLEGLRDVLCAD